MGEILEFLKCAEVKMDKKVEKLGNKLNDIIEQMKSQQASSSSAQQTNEYMVSMWYTLKMSCLIICIFNRIVKYTLFWMQGARDFEEHLDRVEKDWEEKEEDEEMNLESTKLNVLRKKDDDQDDEGNWSMAGNQNQTSRVLDGGTNKLNISETTTDQQGKGRDGSPYKVNK